MIGLYRRGSAIDPSTLRSELADRDALGLAGGAAYISSLIDGLPSVVNVQHYADIIKGKARLRAIAESANAIVTSTMNGAKDLDERLVHLAVSAKAKTERPADFERLEEGRYRLTEPCFGIELEVDHLRRERGQLHGELTVWCSLPGARTTDGLLSSGSFNLSSQQVRGSQGKYLASRARTGNELDWTGLLEEFCHQVLTSERVGEPAVLLRDLPRPLPEEDFEVGGLRLLAHHPVVLFGDGGSAKSYIALHVAGVLAQRGLRVGLFDWELCGEDHRDRLERLFGADMPDVRYLRCSQPLCHMVDAVRRMVVDHELDYIILDSLAFACDGPPEAAEVAGRYFQALRKLASIGSLHIAHISKAEGADRKPFGSAFWHNGARSTWFAKRADSGPDASRIMVWLYNRKANLGALRPPVGFEIAFGQERTTVRPVDVATVPDLSGQLSVRQRMAHLLRSGGMNADELATELDAKLETVKRTARRYPRQFTILDGGRLGLLEKTA